MCREIIFSIDLCSRFSNDVYNNSNILLVFYEGYSESNLHLFLATIVEAGESLHMQGNVT
jgi:hypothetical protein